MGLVRFEGGGDEEEDAVEHDTIHGTAKTRKNHLNMRVNRHLNIVIYRNLAPAFIGRERDLNMSLLET